jgi:hypothetical protein
MWQENVTVATRNRTTRLSLADAVALLHICRQIYHETIDILYSQNHFTLSPLYRQAYWIGDWTHTIALQTQCLRRVTVDAQSLIPKRSSWIMDQTVDVLHLLRLVWDPKSPNVQISLYDCAKQAGGISNIHPADLGGLNTSLQLLGYEHNMKLRQYTISKKLLDSVTISGPESSGTVTMEECMVKCHPQSSRYQKIKVLLSRHPTCEARRNLCPTGHISIYTHYTSSLITSTNPSSNTLLSSQKISSSRFQRTRPLPCS